MNLRSFADILRDAEAGPLLEAEIISLTDKGKLRVTYHWLYSALNCAPEDTSSFPWILTKIDETRVSLSPKNGPGRTVYASVRDDWYWFVQVQAPRSADWITAVARNEIMVMTAPGLQMIRLQGWNGQFVAVDSKISRDARHGGYRLLSVGAPDPKAYTWFLAVTSVLQAGVDVPRKEQLTFDDVRAALASSGLETTDADAAALHLLLS